MREQSRDSADFNIRDLDPHEEHYQISAWKASSQWSTADRRSICGNICNEIETRALHLLIETPLTPGLIL